MRDAWTYLDLSVYETLNSLAPMRGIGYDNAQETEHPFYVKHWTHPTVDLKFLRPLSDFTEAALEEELGN